MRLSPLRARRWLTMIACAGVGLAAAACSLVASTSQCETDDDCRAKGAAFAGTTCQAEACLPPRTSTPCSRNADCAAAGAFAVCRRDVGACVRLDSEDCAPVGEAWSRDDAIYVGLLLKRGAPDASGSDLGASPDMEAGAELAVAEIDAEAGGVPRAKGPPSPLVVVACDQRKDPVRAARHLVGDVGVPAIVGPTSSGVAVQVLGATVPGDALLISPSATSSALTTYDDRNLFWRTVPSDDLQGRALAEVLEELETETATARGGRPFRAVVVTKSDAYGIGLLDTLTTNLVLNGHGALENRDAGNLLLRSYPDTDDPANASFDFTALAGAVAAFAPDAIVGLGTQELAKVVTGVEDAWPASAARANWLFSEGAAVPEVLAAIDARGVAAADLRARTRGTQPLLPTGPTFAGFALRYATSYPTRDPRDGAANAYDAMYVVAYALAAAPPGALDGQAVAAGIGRLVPPGDAFDVGPDAVNEVFAALSAGGRVDLRGASGALDFDARGDVVVDTDVWCVHEGGGTSTVASSGQTYAAATDALVGTFGQSGACEAPKALRRQTH